MANERLRTILTDGVAWVPDVLGVGVAEPVLDVLAGTVVVAILELPLLLDDAEPLLTSIGAFGIGFF